MILDETCRVATKIAANIIFSLSYALLKYVKDTNIMSYYRLCHNIGNKTARDRLQRCVLIVMNSLANRQPN